jgi:hypothetical protein
MNAGILSEAMFPFSSSAGVCTISNFYNFLNWRLKKIIKECCNDLIMQSVAVNWK